jgi:hypothetical protein
MKFTTCQLQRDQNLQPLSAGALWLISGLFFIVAQEREVTAHPDKTGAEHTGSTAELPAPQQTDEFVKTLTVVAAAAPVPFTRLTHSSCPLVPPTIDI